MLKIRIKLTGINGPNIRSERRSNPRPIKLTRTVKMTPTIKQISQAGK